MQGTREEGGHVARVLAPVFTPSSEGLFIRELIAVKSVSEALGIAPRGLELLGLSSELNGHLIFGYADVRSEQIIGVAVFASVVANAG